MILLTGGAGFIGSHLLKALIDKNEKVVVVDNFNKFYDPNLKRQNLKPFENKIHLYEEDIRNLTALDKIFKNHNFNLIIHLAAMAGVRPSIEDPGLYTEVNVNGTLNLLECAKKYKIKDFIFASSSSVYGNNEKVPFSETDNVDNPISPYAATKKAGELLCYNYSHLYKMNISCLRFFTVYGPGQRPEMAIHKFARLLLENKPIPVFGDGTSSRDYTYIDDIVDGILKAMNKLKGYNIYNLGGSKTTRLIDLVKMLGKALNTKPIIQHLPLQAGDVKTTFADVNKAQRELGYKPETAIEFGIQKFARWVED